MQLIAWNFSLSKPNLFNKLVREQLRNTVRKPKGIAKVSILLSTRLAKAKRYHDSELHFRVIFTWLGELLVTTALLLLHHSQTPAILSWQLYRKTNIIVNSKWQRIASSLASLNLGRVKSSCSSTFGHGKIRQPLQKFISVLTMFPWLNRSSW